MDINKDKDCANCGRGDPEDIRTIDNLHRTIDGLNKEIDWMEGQIDDLELENKALRKIIAESFHKILERKKKEVYGMAPWEEYDELWPAGGME